MHRIGNKNINAEGNFTKKGAIGIIFHRLQKVLGDCLVTCNNISNDPHSKGGRGSARRNHVIGKSPVGKCRRLHKGLPMRG